MTREDLRDQFAIAALAGPLAQFTSESAAEIARAAYDIAAAIMAERARRAPQRERPAPTAIPGETP